jgi:hypothetical protein
VRTQHSDLRSLHFYVLWNTTATANVPSLTAVHTAPLPAQHTNRQIPDRVGTRNWDTSCSTGIGIRLDDILSAHFTYIRWLNKNHIQILIQYGLFSHHYHPAYRTTCTTAVPKPLSLAAYPYTLITKYKLRPNVQDNECDEMEVYDEQMNWNGKNMLVNITDTIVRQNGVLQSETWTLWQTMLLAEGQYKQNYRCYSTINNGVTALIWINDITSFQSQYHHEMIRTLSQPKYAFIKQSVMVTKHSTLKV